MCENRGKKRAAFMPPLQSVVDTLLGVVYSAGLADDVDLDLPRILHGLFDLTGDVAGQPQRCQIVDGFGADDDADFASGLKCVALFHTVESAGDFFQCLDALDVGLDALTTCTGTRAGDRVGGFHDIGFDAFLLNFMVMAGDAVHDFGVHTVALGEVGTDGSVCTFDLVVHRFTGVMQQAAHLGEIDIRAEFGSDHPGDVRGLDSVGVLILAVAGAEFEASEQFEDFRMQAVNAGFVCGAFAFFADGVLDFGAGILDQLFDACRMNAPIGDQFRHRTLGDFAAYRVKTADGHGFRCVIHHDIDTGCQLEG